MLPLSVDTSGQWIEESVQACTKSKRLLDGILYEIAAEMHDKATKQAAMPRSALIQARVESSNGAAVVPASVKEPPP